MTSAELFYTSSEVASMFRLTPAALNSRRKRGTVPGSLAVKVGGKYLYPRDVIDQYLSDVTGNARKALGLDEPVVENRSRDPADEAPDPSSP